MNKNVGQRDFIVIGASGYIGSAISNELKNLGLVVDTPSSKLLNLSYKASIEDYFRNKFYNILVYCAINRRGTINSNLLNLTNLIDCGSFSRFILISSRSVYDGFGSFENIQPVPVTNLPKPTESYSLLKYNEEINLVKFKCKHNIIRLFDVFDDRVLENKDHLTKWVSRYFKNGKCTDAISPIHIKDATTLIVENIINPDNMKEIINLCGPNINIGKLALKLNIKTSKEDSIVSKMGVCSFADFKFISLADQITIRCLV